jgi:hypothetical protein
MHAHELYLVPPIPAAYPQPQTSVNSASAW